LLKQPIPPCGQCRQALLEMEDRYKKPLRLLLYGTEGIYVINSVKDILPLTFVGDTMK
ncbi:MAG: cytidine deaminase, partial [Prevotella sp.]|nr:cytidine deaminase [Prevotella sp.]